MLIDWFTVGAQALNFVILVGLMRRFLYKPILAAVAAREKLVAAELADAAAKKAEAGKERDDFQHKSAELDTQRASLLAKATTEANAEGERLKGEARSAADALARKRDEGQKSDARALSAALGKRAGQEVLAIARKALGDLAATSLEERMCEVFTARVRQMDEKTKAQLGDAIKNAAEPALVRSAFELPGAQQAAIQKALNETFSAAVRVRYEVAPELISGIEVSAGGLRVEWSLDGYLASLAKGVDDVLLKQSRPPAAEPKAAVANP